MIPVCILAIEDESDRVFMTALFIQYQKLMYSTILKVTTDAWLADDIFQITLENLIKKIDLLKSLDRDHLVNYILVASRNTAYNVSQYQRRESARYDPECYAGDYSLNGFDVEGYVIEKSQSSVLRSICPKLDSRTKFILESKYILEKTDSEIAKDLGIEPASVRMALSRARRKAQDLMEKELSQ